MNAQRAGSEVAEALRARMQTPAGTLLVVSLQAVDLTAAVAHEPALYRLPGNAAGGRDPWLPFDDQAFDAIVLYRMTSHDVDMQLLLGETARVLRPGGILLVLEHHADFSFAPLPDAGPAHLLHGWLRGAGYAQVEVAAPVGPHLIAIARP